MCLFYIYWLVSFSWMNMSNMLLPVVHVLGSVTVCAIGWENVPVADFKIFRIIDFYLKFKEKLFRITQKRKFIYKFQITASEIYKIVCRDIFSADGSYYVCIIQYQLVLSGVAQTW